MCVCVCVCRKPVFLAPIKFLSSIFKWKIYKIRPTKTNKHNLFMLCIYVRLSVCLYVPPFVHPFVCGVLFSPENEKTKANKNSNNFFYYLYTFAITPICQWLATTTLTQPNRHPKPLGPRLSSWSALWIVFFLLVGGSLKNNRNNKNNDWCGAGCKMNFKLG